MALDLPGERSMSPLTNPVHDIEMPRKVEPGGHIMIS